MPKVVKSGDPYPTSKVDKCFIFVILSILQKNKTIETDMTREMYFTDNEITGDAFMPPTNGSFNENVAHIHPEVTVWRNTFVTHPPPLDATKYNGSKDENSGCFTPRFAPSNYMNPGYFTLAAIDLKP